MVMMIRLTFILFSGIIFPCFGQIDTNHLPEVSVSDTIDSEKNTNQKNLSLSNTTRDNLGDVLNARTPVNIRKTGPSTYASLSYHGLSGSQVSSSWEGIPLYSPSLGLQDFSLIGNRSQGSISITDGPAWKGSGQGYAEINLHEAKPLDLKNQAFLKSEWSSLNNFFSSGRINFSKGHWGASLFYGRRRDENRYWVEDRTSFTGERFLQDHLAFYQDEMVFQVHHKKDRHESRVLYWYQDGFRELPPSLLSRETSEYQEDASNRLALIHKYSGTVWKHAFKLAYFNDLNVYEDSLKSIYGNHQTQQAHFIYNSTWEKSRLKVEPNFRYRWEHALSTNLGNEAKLYHQWAPGLNLGYKITEKLGSRLSVLYPMHSEFESLPQANFNLSFGHKNWVISSEFGSHYRFPSLNDRYWEPGGNSELLPEKGLSSHLKMSRKMEFKNGLDFTASTMVYALWVDQWIQWSPLDNQAFFSPQNLKKVFSRGVDLTLRLESKSFYFQEVIAFNRAEAIESDIDADPSLGKQLVYRPRFQSKTELAYTFENFRITAFNQYLSQRFINSDNRTALEGVNLIGAQVAYDGSWYGLEFSVENLLNTYYELQVYYPMPGRVYQLKITLNPKFKS